MKYRSIFPRIALLLLVAACVSASLFVSGTWAKYASEGKGVGRARFAAFDPVWEYRPELSDLPAANLGAGFIIHPGNVSKEYSLTWRLTNNGETSIKGELVPYVGGDTDAESDHTDSHIGSYRIGRTKLVPYADLADLESIVPGSIFRFGWWPTIEQTGLTAPTNVNMGTTGNYEDFTFTFQGYCTDQPSAAGYGSPPWGLPDPAGTLNHYKTRWANIVGSAPTDDRIVGTAIWRTYRITFDGVVTQVD